MELGVEDGVRRWSGRRHLEDEKEREEKELTQIRMLTHGGAKSWLKAMFKGSTRWNALIVAPPTGGRDDPS
jgi:hypothetical protein